MHVTLTCIATTEDCATCKTRPDSATPVTCSVQHATQQVILSEADMFVCTKVAHLPIFIHPAVVCVQGGCTLHTDAGVLHVHANIRQVQAPQAQSLSFWSDVLRCAWILLLSIAAYQQIQTGQQICENTTVWQAVPHAAGHPDWLVICCCSCDTGMLCPGTYWISVNLLHETRQTIVVSLCS